MPAKKIKDLQGNLPAKDGKFRLYWGMINREVFLGIIILLAVRFYLIIRYGWLVAIDRTGGYDWFFVIIIFIIIGLSLRRVKNLTYKRAAITGGLAGLVLGSFAAILDLLLFHNLWALFNVFRKPLLFTIMGMAVITIVYLLITGDENNFKKQSKN